MSTLITSKVARQTWNGKWIWEHFELTQDGIIRTKNAHFWNVREFKVDSACSVIYCDSKINAANKPKLEPGMNENFLVGVPLTFTNNNYVLPMKVKANNYFWIYFETCDEMRFNLISFFF